VEHLLGDLVPAAVSWDQVLSLLLPLPLIVAANWGLAPPQGDGLPARIARAAGSLIWILLGLVAAASALLGLLTLADASAIGPAASPRGGLVAYAVVMMAAGIVAAMLLLRPNRDRLARVLPIDPASPMDATALVLSVLLVATQLATQLATDVLAQQARSGSALTPPDLISQELPFLLVAALGVGLFFRRSPREALQRLGLVRPTAWQLVLGLAAAGLFYAFGNGVDALGHVLTPGLAHKVEVANQRLFSRLVDPVGIATIALSAGICEEALFRGAMQPRLGLLWPAVVFAAIHTQYGLSFDTVAVLVLAVGLGLLRRITNTTTSTFCHVVYNTLVGVQVGGIWLAPALAVEAALLLGGLAAFFTGKLGSLRTAQ
jgi:membrane protease YdiL (CAAX protease family)